jgi:hypothetical protein
MLADSSVINLRRFSVVKVRKAHFFAVTVKVSKCYVGLLTKRDAGHSHHNASFANFVKTFKLLWGNL